MKRKKLWLILAVVLLAAVSMLILNSFDNVWHKADIDRDGLPDSMEAGYGTKTGEYDTDGDGISDYLEISKYKTNPLKSDSDDDGIPDSEWEEKREYTYSIQAVVDLRPPFDLEHMNDFYQDARIIGGSLEAVTRVEVILYPEAKLIINPDEYKQIDNEYTQRTYTKNYSEKMQDSVLRKVKGKKTDYKAVKAINGSFRAAPFSSQLLSIYKFHDLSRDLKCDSDLPVQFKIYRDENGNYQERDFPISSKYTREEILGKTFFANEMFLGKAAGSCSSIATLRGTLMRAAGIQEKTIFTIPLIYYFEGEKLDMKIKDQYRNGFKNVKGTLADHVFNEVLIGNQWVRIDNHVIDTGIAIYGKNKPYVKILEYHDSTDYNFSTYWNYDTWKEKRPYRYISVIDQEPRHARQ